MFSPLPLSAHPAADFTHINYQSMNSSDIVYIEKVEAYLDDFLIVIVRKTNVHR